MVLFILILLFNFIVSENILAEVHTAGRVVTVTGTVLVRNKNIPDRNALKLTNGDSIYEHDVFNTSSNSSMKILFNDRTIVDLGPSTLFDLDKFKLGKKSEDRKVNMSLKYGKARTSVNKPVGKEGNFTFRTRSLTMGVRGTQWIANISEPEIHNTNSGMAQQTENIVMISGKVTAQKVNSFNNVLGAGAQNNTASRSPSSASNQRANTQEKTFSLSAGEAYIKEETVEVSSVSEPSQVAQQEESLGANEIEVDVDKSTQDVKVTPVATTETERESETEEREPASEEQQQTAEAPPSVGESIEVKKKLSSAEHQSAIDNKHELAPLNEFYNETVTIEADAKKTQPQQNTPPKDTSNVKPSTTQASADSSEESESESEESSSEEKAVEKKKRKLASKESPKSEIFSPGDIAFDMAMDEVTAAAPEIAQEIQTSVNQGQGLGSDLAGVNTDPEKAKEQQEKANEAAAGGINSTTTLTVTVDL